MKKLLFTTCAALLFMLAAAAETITLSGVKFIPSRVQVKDLGNGTFELTIPPGKGWPLVQIIPENMPAHRDRVAMTIQQIAPQGSLSYRLRLALEPAKTSDNLQLTQILKDNKPHRVELAAFAGKKMTHFSLAAHMPDKEIKLLISDIKASFGTAKKAVKPLPPVMFKGKPMFPVGAWDFGDRDRKSGFPLTPVCWQQAVIWQKSA